jgi:hypothetical protein
MTALAPQVWPQGAPFPMTRGRLVQWRMDLPHLALLGSAILLVYAPGADGLLRPWDHHAILLLTAVRRAGQPLFWRLLHYHIGFEELVFFKILSMPTVYAVARLFRDHVAGYYALHFAAHLGVTAVLYFLVVELSGARRLAALTGLLFAVYAAHADTVVCPYYTYLYVAMLIAGVATLFFLRHLRDGDRRSLVLSVALLVVATLFYDAFFLLALALPVLAIGMAPARDRGSIRTEVGLLAGALAVFAIVVLSLWLAPTPPATTGGALGRGVRATAAALAPESRVPMAPLYAVWAVAADLVVFLTGHFPGLWHRGNLPYWNLDAVAALTRTNAFALGLLLAGGACVRRWGWRGRVAGAVLVVAGLLVDPLAALLATLVGLVGRRALADRRVAFLATAAILTAFNIALGRGLGYNVAAFRHHYVSGFFVLAVVAALAGAGWAGRPAWRNHLLLGALGVCVLLNAQATLRLFAETARDNERVLAFNRSLGVIERAQGPRVLFAAFPTSEVEGSDWHGNPVQDVVFDLLHAGGNPQTRHLSRARFVVGRDGLVRPNPEQGREQNDDFAFRFRLRAFLPGRYELFGSAPREPRIVLEPGQLSLVAVRREEGRPITWQLEFPRAMKLPAVVALAREDGTLRLLVDGEPAAVAMLGDADAYHGWESDNLGLLGRDFERLTVLMVVAESYMRIGRRPAGEEPK